MPVFRRLLSAVLLLLPMLLSLSTESRAAVDVLTSLRGGNIGAVALLDPPAPGAPRLIFAAVSTGWDNAATGQIERSPDGGATWAPVLYLKCFSLAADPNVPGTIYAATVDGLYRSTAYGEPNSWVRVTDLVRSHVVVAPWNSSVIFGDHLRSIDNGANWAPMAGLPAYNVSYSRAPGDLPHIKVSADPSRMIAFAGTNAVYVSTNQGASWSPLTNMQGNSAYSVGIGPADARYYYVGYCNELQRWFPGGTYVNGSLSGDLYNIAIDPGRPNRLYAEGQGNLFRSYDNMATSMIRRWSVLRTVPAGRMIVDPDGTVYLPTWGAGLQYMQTGCTDKDGDGFFSEPDCGTARDCNDSNNLVNPGMAETCDSTVDHDCDGKAGCQDNVCVGTATCAVCADADGDGYYTHDYCIPGLPKDCDDTRAAIFPGAPEIVLDGIDQDCNGYDLTIKVTTATWSRSTNTILVEATSGYGASADLSIQNFGVPMSYVPPSKRLPAGKWTGSIPDYPNGAGFTVYVGGPEGSVTATVKAVR